MVAVHAVTGHAWLSLVITASPDHTQPTPTADITETGPTIDSPGYEMTHSIG